MTSQPFAAQGLRRESMWPMPLTPLTAAVRTLKVPNVSSSSRDLALAAWCIMRAAFLVARMKHQAARAKSRLEELTFGTFNVRTAAVKGVNGIGHIDSLLRPCAAKGCDVLGLPETKRDGTSQIVATGYRATSAGIAAGSKGGKGNMELDWR